MRRPWADGRAARRRLVLVVLMGTAATAFGASPAAAAAPPVAGDDHVYVYTDTFTELSVLNNDSDDYDFRFEQGPEVTSWDPSSTQGGTVSCGIGHWCEYTPPSGFRGFDTFTYEITDAEGLKDSATVTVEVADQFAPTAVDDVATALTAVPVSVHVWGNDTDPTFQSRRVTAWDATSVEGGTVSCADGFSCVYTSAAGFEGTDTFTYTLTDAEVLSDVATVTMTVSKTTFPFVPIPSLDALGGTSPRSVSSTGVVVGTARDCAGGCHNVPFRWEPGDASLTQLVLPAGALLSPSFELRDVSDSGWILGYYYDETGGARGAVWSPGSVVATAIGPGSGYTFPEAVNEVGGVTGRYIDGDQQAFVWSLPDGFQLIGPGSGAGINDSGWVVGNVFPDTGPYTSFVWDPTTSVRTELPLPDDGADYLGVVARGIADDGTVGGTADVLLPPGLEDSRAVAWPGAGVGELPGDPVVLSPYSSVSVQVLANGVVVGQGSTPDGGRVFRWDSGATTILGLGPGASLASTPTVSPGGWISTTVHDGLGDGGLVQWPPGETLPTELGSNEVIGSGMFHPTATNDSGWMVGQTGTKAFIWGPDDVVVVDDNGDGIPDDEQVGSVPTDDGDLTLSAPFGTRLTALSVDDPPTPPPGGIQAQTGLISFAVEGTIGTDLGTVDVVVTLPDGVDADAYWKLLSGTWVDASSISDFTVPGEVTLSMTDNGPFDTDGRLGAIADPGVFALDVRLYAATGFAAPVDAEPTVNVAKAGSTIPLTWVLQLRDGGAPVTSATSFAGLSFSGTACEAAASDAIETYTTTTGLKHLGSGRWQLGWKAPKSLAGRCGTVEVTFDDGTSLTAAFRFK